jgi:TP901-1 family phage major tail protein
MAAQLGRTLGLQLDTTGSGSYQTIASLRTKSLKIANEDVDVTTGDSANQWRELLANAGVKSMEISFAGVFDDGVYINQVRALALAGTIRNWKITHPAVGTYTAPFQISNFEESGEYNGALEFTASLTSAGEVTFTAA